MKSRTFVILVIACLVVQFAESAPQDTQDKAQEFFDRVKVRAQEAVEHAQEAAARAVEAARSAVQEAMESVHQATQQGIEAGHEWIEYGKNLAASFSNQTATEKVEKQDA